MNILLVIIPMVGGFAALAFMFIPFLYFLIGGFGVMIGVGPTLILIYLVGPRMYYYKIRFYEDRGGRGAYVEKDFRARLVKGKDEQEYLETPLGERFRFTELKYFQSGCKGQLFGDLFRGQGTGKESQVFPVRMEISKKDKDEIRKKVIPVDQRAWFSNNRVLGYIKEATKIPLDMKLQMITTFSFISAVLMIAIVLIFYPMFLEETTTVLRADAAGKAAMYKQLLDSLEASQPIVCQYDIINPVPPTPPEPPPESPPT